MSLPVSQTLSNLSLWPDSLQVAPWTITAYRFCCNKDKPCGSHRPSVVQNLNRMPLGQWQSLKTRLCSTESIKKKKKKTLWSWRRLRSYLLVKKYCVFVRWHTWLAEREEDDTPVAVTQNLYHCLHIFVHCWHRLLAKRSWKIQSGSRMQGIVQCHLSSIPLL